MPETKITLDVNDTGIQFKIKKKKNSKTKKPVSPGSCSIRKHVRVNEN